MGTLKPTTPLHAPNKGPLKPPSPVWRVLEGPEGLAEVLMSGGRAWPRQISHAIPPRHDPTQAQKPQNINDQISKPEILSGELHAKLMGERPVGPQAARHAHSAHSAHSTGPEAP